jgi:hypothetical protein
VNVDKDRMLLYQGILRYYKDALNTPGQWQAAWKKWLPKVTSAADVWRVLRELDYTMEEMAFVANHYELKTPADCQEALEGCLYGVTSAAAAGPVLRKLGYTREAVYGYTPQAIWKDLNREHEYKLTDKYNTHGISKEIPLVNADELKQDVQKRPRALSQLLAKNPRLQATLDEEAKQPRTFIRTWVRLVPRPSGT